MLFPRCIHRRLCCHGVLLHEFHTTRPYLRESLDALKIDPINAQIIIGSKSSSPGRSRSKSDSRKIKTLRAGKQSKERSDRMDHFFESDKFASRLRLYNRRVRCPRTLGGAEVIGPRLPTVVESPEPFQIDPTTAQIIPGSKPSSPGHSQSKSDSRKTKTLSARKQRKEGSDGMEHFSDSDKLSSPLRRYNRRVRCPRTVGGAEATGARLTSVLNGRLSSPSSPMEREAHLGASKNAEQPGPSDDRKNTSRLPSSLLCGADGVIHPRARGDPFLEDVLPPSPQSPVATLAHGLERVLFRPGVQWLQDPRSKVYNFSTWLQQIIPVKNFAFERLQPFVPSSRDEDLYAIAKREGRKYAGSTSSLSGLLSQLYFLISGDKLVNTAGLGRSFRKTRTFTPGQRVPASVILRYRDGVYLIDGAEGAVPGLSNKNILTWMGTLLEKFVTHTPGEFIRLTRSVDSAVVGEEPRREAYRYAKSDKFALRSQLDCFHGRLPGSGVFDIKTRAVMAIRHDLLNFEENSGYQIRAPRGFIESFEREYYDLIRSAFLKYSFQARIGNMDGVFVAYHNTERIFGFQYIPLSEMDARLFGKHASGNAVFEKCMQLLEAVLEKATRELPHQSIRLTAEKLKTENKLRVFLEPAEWDELQGSRPVVQLDVEIKHYIGESATYGPIAVDRSSQPWTVLWSVSKSTLDPNVIRNNLADARKRASFPLFLPRGVAPQQMEKFWHELQFNPAAPVEVPFKPELIRSPPKGIRSLRWLARKGRQRLEHSIRKQKGRPKVVLGIPNDDRTVAPLMALAHGPGFSRSNLDAVDNTTGANLSENQEQTTRKAKNPRRRHPLTLAVSQFRPQSRPHRFTPSPRQNPLFRIVKPRGAATSSQRQNRRTKGDHARFGELSLADGPIGRTRKSSSGPKENVLRSANE